MKNLINAINVIASSVPSTVSKQVAHGAANAIRATTCISAASVEYVGLGYAVQVTCEIGTSESFDVAIDVGTCKRVLKGAKHLRQDRDTIIVDGARIQGICLDLLPLWPCAGTKFEPCFDATAKDLHDRIDTDEFAASSDPGRSNISQALLSECHAVTTDGHRACVVGVGDYTPDPRHVLLPSELIPLTLKLLKGAEGVVRVSRLGAPGEGNWARVVGSNFILTFREHEAQFPPIEQVIRHATPENSTTVSFDKKEFVGILETMKKAGKSREQGSVHSLATRGAKILNAIAVLSFEAETGLPEISGGNIEFELTRPSAQRKGAALQGRYGCAVCYLLDHAKAVQGPTVDIDLPSEMASEGPRFEHLAPYIVRGTTKGKQSVLIVGMPCRI